MTSARYWLFFIGLSLLLHLSGTIGFAALDPGAQDPPAGKLTTSTVDSIEEILGAPESVAETEIETVEDKSVTEVEEVEPAPAVQEVTPEVEAEAVVAANSPSEAPITAVQESQPKTLETLTPTPTKEVQAEEAKQPKPEAVKQPEKKVEKKKKVERKKPKKRKKKVAKRASKKGNSRRNAAGQRRSGGGGTRRASLGAVQNYGVRVRARIAANKPGAVGRGRVRISLGISKSGGLRYARVAGSSGNAAIDRAALRAVRRSAPFPRPPAGASLRQLTFAIPFTFR
ncbi:MAG: TonB family protein [Pseudomonadota bacterium]